MPPAVTAPAATLDPGSVLVGQDLEAQSRELDRQLQSTDAHRELLDRFSADLIAGRRTLPEAAGLLADFSRQRWPEWFTSLPDRWRASMSKRWSPSSR
jgi:hypothetical protein